MITKELALKLTLSKLENSLKGSASMILDAGDKIYTPEERKIEMGVIEEVLQYVRDYSKNKRLLEEYTDFRERFEDDGR